MMTQNTKNSEEREVSQPSSITTATAKTLATKAVRTLIDEHIPGFGNYISGKFKQANVAIDFIHRYDNAILAGRSQNDAFVCSLSGTTAKLATNIVGNIGLAALIAENPASWISSAALWTAGTAVIEANARAAGTLAENLCHLGFRHENHIHHILTRYSTHQISFSIKRPISELHSEMHEPVTTTATVNHQTLEHHLTSHLIEMTEIPKDAVVINGSIIETDEKIDATGTVTPRLSINLNDPSQSTVGLDVTLNPQGTLQMGLTTTMREPIKNLRPTVSQTMGNGNLGASTSFKRPLKDIQPSFATNSGFFVNTHLKNPIKNMTVGIPVIPGVGINVPLRRLSAASINIDPVNFSAKRAIKDVRNGLRKLRGKKKHIDEITVGSTGLPWFVPDFNRGGGTERLEPNALNQRFCDVKNKFNALYVDLKQIQNKYHYAEILLPFIQKISELENAIQKSKGLSVTDQIKLAQQVSKFVNENNDKFHAWTDFCLAMNQHYKKAIDLHNEIIAEANFLSYVLHAYDFSQYPWPRKVYFDHYNGFYDLQKSTSDYIDFIKDANGYVEYTIQLSNVINYCDTLPGIQLAAISDEFNQAKSILKDIYTKHDYHATLLPFILNAEKLEDDIQMNLAINNLPEINQTVESFMRSNEANLDKWIEFYSELYLYVSSLESLRLKAGTIIEKLSHYINDNEKIDDALKAFYFKCYHELYVLYENIDNQINVAKNGSHVFKNQIKLANIINYHEVVSSQDNRVRCSL